MKRKSLLILLLLALMAPWAAKAQQTQNVLTENFNGMSSFANAYSATGWYAYNAGSGNNWTLSTSDGVSSSKCAKYGFNSSNAANCYLVSAPFNVSANMTELTVSLQEKVASSTWTERFEVFFVKASDVTDNASITTATKYIVLSEQTYSNTSYAEATNSVSDAELAGQSVRVVVHCTSDKDKYNLFIDDITVTETFTMTDPYIMLDPNSATVLTGFTQTLTATYGNVTGTPTINYTTSDASVATVSGSGTTATVTGVSPGTATITATMNIGGTDYTATAAITVEDPSYCEPSFIYSESYGMYITNFTTSAGINNSTGFSTGGYGNYYDTHAAAIEPGETLSFTISQGSNSSYYTFGYAIWVDWNHDYEFSSDERVAFTTSATAESSWSGSFTVGSDTPVGDYRMRVLMQYSTSSPSNPCASANYGEGEDYKLSVVAPSDCPRTNSLTAQATGDQAVLSWASTATAWQVCLNDDESNLIDVTENPYTLENLTLSTDYTVKVRANCTASGDGYGDWSNTASFTTGICAADDMCAITYTLTDAYGDGWNGNKMEVRNSSTNELIATWTFSSGGSTTGTLSVCEGITLDFVYVASGNYQYENGWTITDINEEIISTHEGCSNSSDCDAPTAGTIATYTVNCTVPTCIKPTMNATATNIEATSATVSWTAGNEGQEHWDVYYCTGTATAPTASTEPQVKYTSDNPLTLTGLQAAETYYVWVRGNCGTEEEPDYSDWSAAYCTFTTTEYCADIKVDYYTIEFTDYTSSGVTVSWTAAGGATQWRVQVYDLQTSPYELKDEQVVTAPTATIDGLQSQLGYQVDIAPYCAEADDYTPTVSKLFSTLDDCPSPTDLAANDVTASSASISWTNNGLTEFNLRYSCDNTVTWIDKPNVTSPCTIDELPANTKIYVQVQGTCDATNDRWEEMTFFTTCEAYTVTRDYPYIQDFESPVTTATSNTNDGSLIVVPNCWDHYHNGAYVYYKPHIIKSDAGSSINFSSPASQVLFFLGSGNGYAALPEFTNAISELQIKFNWAVENKNYGTLTLGYITAEDDGTFNTFQTIKEYKSSDATDAKVMQQADLYLNEVPAEAARLVFRWWYSTGWYCNIDDVEVSLMPSCYPVGTLAAATEVKSTSAKLSWALTDNTQTEWEVAYKIATDADFTSVDATTNIGFLLEGLTAEKEYTVKVRANCGSEDGYSAWSNEITFTTAEACMKPTEIIASNITAVSADLTWTGESDEYNVMYREVIAAAVNTNVTYDFEDGLQGWTPYDEDGDGYFWVHHGQNANHGNFCVQARYNSSAIPNNWLISPQIALGGTLSFYAKNSSGKTERFYVYVSTTGTDISNFTAISEEETPESTYTYYEYDLSSYSGNGYVAIKHTSDVDQYWLYVDDINYVCTIEGEYGEWQDAHSYTHDITLEDLVAGKTYEVKVQGVCEGVESAWSLVSEFTTLADGNKVFVTEGNWNEGANWAPAGAPALTDDVIIRANTTIPSSCVALADEITIEGENTITIEDGGQLLHSNNGVVATMKKDVKPYNDATGIDNYIFLASPIFTPTSPANVVNMISSTQPYDLYRFDQTEDLEWRNYEADGGEFDLVSGMGYLYAHNYGATTTLSFTGELLGSLADKSVNLDYISGKNWAGWNLIGNPFACNANVSINAEGTFNYYTIDANGDFVDADGAVAPMEGIFVEATEAGQKATFTRVVPGETSVGPTDGILNVNLMANEAASRNGNSRIDMARLRFGHGNNLSKLNLFRSNATVFFPQDGKDYSVMYAEAQGEMPLHFKTEKNGTYTLGFTTEDVSFGYLHLIDNLTGNDVDLLATPSYSFDARTTDYASRFRLVFATGSSAEGSSFGFINAAGNFCVFGIEGEATLQVIDLMGRILSSESFSGSYEKPINAATGVYMVRLINGNDVKTQKVVVR